MCVICIRRKLQDGAGTVYKLGQELKTETKRRKHHWSYIYSSHNRRDNISLGMSLLLVFQIIFLLISCLIQKVVFCLPSAPYLLVIFGPVIEYNTFDVSMSCSICQRVYVSTKSAEWWCF